MRTSARHAPGGVRAAASPWAGSDSVSSEESTTGRGAPFGLGPESSASDNELEMARTRHAAGWRGPECNSSHPSAFTRPLPLHPLGGPVGLPTPSARPTYAVPATRPRAGSERLLSEAWGGYTRRLLDHLQILASCRGGVSRLHAYLAVRWERLETFDPTFAAASLDNLASMLCRISPPAAPALLNLYVGPCRPLPLEQVWRLRARSLVEQIAATWTELVHAHHGAANLTACLILRTALQPRPAALRPCVKEPSASDRPAGNVDGIIGAAEGGQLGSPQEKI